MKFPDPSQIKQVRRALGLTQAALAKQSGVSQSTIAKIERGNVKGSYAEVVKIFVTLDEAKDKTAKTCLRDISSKKVVSIQANETVKKASEIMRYNGISQMPILDGEEPVGSISEKSILTLIMTGAKMEDLGRRPIRSIMDEPFPMVSEDMDKTYVEPLLLSQHAVLTTKSGHITGIVTSADLIRFE